MWCPSEYWTFEYLFKQKKKCGLKEARTSPRTWFEVSETQDIFSACICLLLGLNNISLHSVIVDSYVSGNVSLKRPLLLISCLGDGTLAQQYKCNKYSVVTEDLCLFLRRNWDHVVVRSRGWHHFSCMFEKNLTGSFASCAAVLLERCKIETL